MLESELPKVPTVPPIVDPAVFNIPSVLLPLVALDVLVPLLAALAAMVAVGELLVVTVAGLFVVEEVTLAVAAVVTVLISCCTGGTGAALEMTAPLGPVMVELPVTVAFSFCTLVLNAALPLTLSVAVPPTRLGPVMPGVAETLPPTLRLIAPLPALTLANTTLPEA